MQLPHTLWLNDNVRARNRLRNWEISAVNLPPLTSTSWSWFWRMLKRTINVRSIASEFAVSACDGEVGAFSGCAVLDVRVGRGDARED